MSRLISSFDSLRPWRGSIATAFEELCYQLFKADAPEGTVAIRTGNPDGGVEWYASLPDGSQWGWQAKHVHSIDDLLRGMSESVRAVTNERPNLTRLSFLISSNLATGTSGRQRKSQRQKYEDKVASWQASIKGADQIDFHLIQESDILDRLAQPEHKGREWFWFGDTSFTPVWFERRLSEQTEEAGEKYRPSLQVDLPIETDVAALGFDISVIEHLDRLIRDVASKASDFWLNKEGPDELIHAYEAITESVARLTSLGSSPHFQPSMIEADLAPLLEAFDQVSLAVEAAEDIEHVIESEWREAHPDHDRSAVRRNTPSEARGYRCQDLVNRVADVRRWLDSTTGRALRSGLYFLEGVAGSGKTHLLLGATTRALSGDRPAVFLNAARFGSADLWASLCDQLGLPPVGADVLLGAMDAAGEASAMNGRRFVISIDALNETTDPLFWQVHLPALRSAIESWPHVALAVSCRDTYMSIVWDDSESDSFVRRSHPGFAGLEVDATQKYFAFHGLEAPRIPLLIPEFRLPLFLRLFCEGLRDSGETEYGGHEGSVQVFERYIETKLTRVAQSFRPQAATGYEKSKALEVVSDVLDAILDEFALTGREAVSIARAEELAESILGAAEGGVAVVLGAMQSEGILNQELLYTEKGESGQGLRIVFQALADYMILRRRLSKSPEPASDETLHHWLREECSWGILEAATVVMPELLGVELPDILGIRGRDLREPDSSSQGDYRRFNRHRHIAEAVIRRLPYRASEAVTDRTVELLNECLHLIGPEELFQVMFLLAPQPNNQLNGDRLHRHLAGVRMPERDEYFGFATYHELSEETTPAAVLARWASKGPYPSYDPEVVELACIPLIWLLLSPNRYMRDWITKALVELLRGHIAVLDRLVARFWPVDDPYVVQRVIVIAYGALMRSHSDQRGHAGALVERVSKLAFSSPDRADEILLDAARGIVEWGVENGVAQKASIESIKRPYGFKKPGPAPSEKTLDEKYGWREDQPYEESYSSVFHSVLGLGDFGRYVIEPGVRTFSRYPLDRPYPDPEAEETQGPKVVKAKWAKFVESLSPSQATQLESALERQSTVGVDGLEMISIDFFSNLTPEQTQLFSSSFRQRRPRKWRDDTYPLEKARRWVFARTLRLGWTPKRFGRADRQLGWGTGGREAQKAERWGKKYQWMAYHELLARVADNFHAAKRFGDHETYEGLHQLIGDREIDPTLPPVPLHQLLEPEKGNDTWRNPPITLPAWPPVSIDFPRLDGDLLKFISDVESEPAIDRVLTLKDTRNETWVLLDASIQQGDPSAHKAWLGLQESFHLISWFVPASETGPELSSLPRLIRDHESELVDRHGHVDCCYFGEIGWSPHSCYNRHADPIAFDFGGEPLHLAQVAEDYLWEGSLYDCSIAQSVSATLPSAFVRARTNLQLSEHGPSWSDEQRTVFTNYVAEGDERQRTFLVNADWLGEFMAEHGLELIVWTSTLRWLIEDRVTRSNRLDKSRDTRLDVYGAARLDHELNLAVAPALRLIDRTEQSPL